MKYLRYKKNHWRDVAQYMIAKVQFFFFFFFFNNNNNNNNNVVVLSGLFTLWRWSRDRIATESRENHIHAKQVITLTLASVFLISVLRQDIFSFAIVAERISEIKSGQ
jgi:hypothetical protein